ncbi:MAG: hypothetical protein BroJett018_14610 [Chloroflexota bacterium]|nr:Uma2 family endonuclease [Chloroflexota bacterium]NOG65177.1 Uma2 family endonuclease [Chloroflexota bacterium]GIK63667.1 MAG: hypothetical protein BroJett018_14610 [Chloroflexota bacterium]
MNLQEFLRTYSDKGPFELVDGQKIRVVPQVVRIGRIASRIARWIGDFVETENHGEAFLKTPYLIYVGEQILGSRVPDIMFIRAERLVALAENDPDWEEKPLTIVPDLVVEVVSPTDRLTKINRKISRYLKDGVLVIWLVDADSKTVTIYKQGQTNLELLTIDDVLLGGEIIPGFEVAVSKLF